MNFLFIVYRSHISRFMNGPPFGKFFGVNWREVQDSLECSKRDYEELMMSLLATILLAVIPRIRCHFICHWIFLICMESGYDVTIILFLIIGQACKIDILMPLELSLLDLISSHSPGLDVFSSLHRDFFIGYSSKLSDTRSSFLAVNLCSPRLQEWWLVSSSSSSR